jgi:hypothetical protein
MFKSLFKRRRAETRRNVDIATTVRDPGGTEQRVRIVSLSARGFRLSGCAGIDEGASLTILLPGYGEVGGRVVWTAGDECGGILQSPIPIDDIALTATPS